MFKMNKKAAIGATMTWVVATIILLVVTIFFIYSSYILAEEKEMLGFELFVQEVEQSSSIQSEQILLALLETELEGKKIKDYIINRDYNLLEEKINPILSKIRDDNWAMYIYDGNEVIKINAISELRKTKSSIVYVGNTKVKLFSNLIG